MKCPYCDKEIACDVISDRDLGIWQSKLVKAREIIERAEKLGKDFWKDNLSPAIQEDIRG